MKIHKNPLPEPLALFGGTFDPVHYGHLRCAEEARRKLGLQTLYLLPAGDPPHRPGPQATTLQRLRMLQLALPEFPNLDIDQRELDRHGPSYMVDTLRDLRKEAPQRPVLLLIGQDAANLLHSWHRWMELFTLAHLVIMTRPGSKAEYRQDLADQIQERRVIDASELARSGAGGVMDLVVSAVDISATSIKSRVRSGLSARGMLPAAVLDYIERHGLYLTD